MIFILEKQRTLKRQLCYTHSQKQCFKIIILFMILSYFCWSRHHPTNHQTIFLIFKNGEKDKSSENLYQPQENRSESTKIVILMWTGYYQVTGETLMKLILTGQSSNPFCCADVEITLERKRVQEAIALVFFQYEDNLIWEDLPSYRRNDQLWILFSKESPRYSLELSPFNEIFNWTMSYRKDSEIWAPYGQFIPLSKGSYPEKNNGDDIQINGMNLTSWISGKRKLITGVISHCNTASLREDYIERLRLEGINAKIYGSCGFPTCPRLNFSCNHNSFWNKLASRYKFYFSGENAWCSDYITEKFWRPLQLGMIPVAYGKANYSAVAPRGSFIDAKDFSSPKELADYLVKLDNDPFGKYKKYFEWRRKFYVRTDECWQGWCPLCEAVTKFRRKLKKDPKLLSTISHTYKDLAWWWSHSGEKETCSTPTI